MSRFTATHKYVTMESAFGNPMIKERGKEKLYAHQYEMFRRYPLPYFYLRIWRNKKSNQWTFIIIQEAIRLLSERSWVHWKKMAYYSLNSEQAAQRWTARQAK